MSAIQGIEPEIDYFCIKIRAMKFIPTEFKDLWIIEPRRFSDARGYFSETFRRDLFEEATGLRVDFVQDNESVSSRGVVRGLHYQKGEAAQAKLVRVAEGVIVDVAVDLRQDSPTFGRHVAVELSQENGRQLFVPRGFAHGFAVLSDRAQFLYKVDNYYCPQAECCIRFDDMSVGVRWPVAKADMVLSEKDLRGLSWDESEKF